MIKFYLMNINSSGPNISGVSNPCIKYRRQGETEKASKKIASSHFSFDKSLAIYRSKYSFTGFVWISLNGFSRASFVDKILILDWSNMNPFIKFFLPRSSFSKGNVTGQNSSR